MRYYNINLYQTREVKFKKITIEQFREHGWYYDDGSQPISNGEWGIVIDGDRITHIISCCSNCGDYNVIDEQDMTGNVDAMEKLMKDLFRRWNSGQ